MSRLRCCWTCTRRSRWMRSSSLWTSGLPAARPRRQAPVREGARGRASGCLGPQRPPVRERARGPGGFVWERGALAVCRAPGHGALPRGAVLAFDGRRVAAVHRQCGPPLAGWYDDAASTLPAPAAQGQDRAPTATALPHRAALPTWSPSWPAGTAARADRPDRACLRRCPAVPPGGRPVALSGQPYIEYEPLPR